MTQKNAPVATNDGRLSSESLATPVYTTGREDATSAPVASPTLSPDATKILRYLAGCHGGVEAAQVARDTHVDWLVCARELSHLELAGLCHRHGCLWFQGSANQVTT